MKIDTRILPAIFYAIMVLCGSILVYGGMQWLDLMKESDPKTVTAFVMFGGAWIYFKIASLVVRQSITNRSRELTDRVQKLEESQNNRA